MECSACRRVYNPKPKTKTTIYAGKTHYACTLSRWEHNPPLRRYARAGHQDGCATRPNHSGGAGLACFGCRSVYSGRSDAVVPVGRYNDNPHWNCSIPTTEHAAYKSKGFGHRPGCGVASGHDLDVEVKNCLTCRKTKYKAIDRPKVLKKKYAMSPEEYAARLAAQDGKCAICHEKDDRQLSVDHSHVTNENRGLLCHRCNIGLGYFRDREDWLLSAAEYLSHARV